MAAATMKHTGLPRNTTNPVRHQLTQSQTNGHSLSRQVIAASPLPCARRKRVHPAPAYGIQASPAPHRGNQVNPPSPGPHHEAGMPTETPAPSDRKIAPSQASARSPSPSVPTMRTGTARPHRKPRRENGPAAPFYQYTKHVNTMVVHTHHLTVMRGFRPRETPHKALRQEIP